MLLVMLEDLTPKDRSQAAADVVIMLQGTGKILMESGVSGRVISEFTEDAQAANRIARETIVEEGFDPILAFQVKLPLKPAT